MRWLRFEGRTPELYVRFEASDLELLLGGKGGKGTSGRDLLLYTCNRVTYRHTKAP